MANRMMIQDEIVGGNRLDNATASAMVLSRMGKRGSNRPPAPASVSLRNRDFVNPEHRTVRIEALSHPDANGVEHWEYFDLWTGTKAALREIISRHDFHLRVMFNGREIMRNCPYRIREIRGAQFLNEEV